MTAATSSRPTSAEPLDRVAVIERALERRANLPAKAAFSLAEQLRSDGRFEEARAVLDDAEARHGASVGLLEQQARLAFTCGDHETALQCLQKRCDLWPSATASIALARFHLETGGIEEARRISDELLRTDPNLLTVQALAGAIARADGDLKGARTFFLAMVDLRTEHPGALLTLAELSFEDGDADSARAFYRRAVAAIAASDPRPAGVLPDAAKIARLLGDDNQADAFATEAESTQSDRAMTALAVLAAAADSVESIGATVRDSAPRASAPSPGTELPDPADLETFDAPPAAGIQADDPRVLQTLRALFGHEALRPGQAEVINQVMAGVDTLAVMPTGAGKSLTFQLPAMIQDGVTVVISPLIALMKDQVDGLPPAVQAKTALINSTLSLEEMRNRLDKLRRGELKLIYVAPERLRQHGFLKALRQVKIATFVVDEAHCISMWGHDFRPDYLFIPRALKEIGEPPVLAITATATQATARFIADGLERKLALVRTSVYRPNLFYSVTHCATRDKKVEAMVEFCRKERGSGIVYVSSRRDAEDLAGLLRSRGVSAGYYHAGMNPDARRSAQEAFMSGQVRVVVATVAFGMGIDKSDVRFIVRFSPPASLEAYAQESGRAGRDGQPAKCLLLIAKTDESTLKRLSKQDRIEIGELRRVYQAIRRQASGRWAIIDVASLQNYSEDEASDPRIALGLLDQARLIRRHPDAAGTLQLRFRPGAFDAPGLGPDQADALSRLKSWLGPEALAVGGLPLETAAACDAIGVAPIELDRLLADIPDVTVREGSRGTCLELLPAGPNAGATMQSLLDKAQADAVERIDRVMAFAEGRRCRHQMLAAHLGEQLAPCNTQCDVCTGTVAARVVADHARGRKETPADRLVVLQALQTAPYSLGAPSLIKLLTGSAESKIQRDRSASFGALSDLAKSAIQRLIDSLIEDGLIDRYERDGYRLLAISRAGADHLGVRYMAP